MTPEEFAAAYPLADHEKSAKTVASRGFKRLRLYFTGELLEKTKVVLVNRVPTPPLSSIGLQRFRELERTDYDGITYLDTIFVKRVWAHDEELHFHKLIHVLQWRLLGSERFLALYADGLEKFGYEDSPLEKMAYHVQNEFSRSKQTFDAQALVVRELRQLSAL
jgi:hypothetical protein